jgi:membrane dipeptidase
MSTTTAEAAADAGVLHSDALVIDTLTPDMAPFTASMYDKMIKMLADHEPYFRIWPAMKRMADSALLEQAYPEYWQWWADSGVDVASITMGGFGADPFSFHNAAADIARWTARFDRHPDRLRKISSAADMDRVHRDGAHGVLLGFQNSDHIEGDVGNVKVFYDLGIRVIQLTYNLRNLVGDGFAERNPAGVSKFGIGLIHALNDIGIMVDLSHCSEPTTLDAIEASRVPVAITHAFASGLNGHPRGKSDKVIRAIGEAGGYFGVVLVPFFLRTDGLATLDDFVAHVDHVVELAGIEHVGVGSDWGMRLPSEVIAPLNAAFAQLGFEEAHGVDWGKTLGGLAGWDEMPRVTSALLQHGYSADQVRALMGGNFRRLFGAVCG